MLTDFKKGVHEDQNEDQTTFQIVKMKGKRRAIETETRRIDSSRQLQKLKLSYGGDENVGRTLESDGARGLKGLGLACHRTRVYEKIIKPQTQNETHFFDTFS